MFFLFKATRITAMCICSKILCTSSCVNSVQKSHSTSRFVRLLWSNMLGHFPMWCFCSKIPDDAFISCFFLETSPPGIQTQKRPRIRILSLQSKYQAREAIWFLCPKIRDLDFLYSFSLGHLAEHIFKVRFGDDGCCLCSKTIQATSFVAFA